MSDIRDFGAVGDAVADDTDAIQHGVDEGDGFLQFPPGRYRVTRPIVVDLAQKGPFALQGSGGTARILMDGAGPALLLKGSHAGTAGPSTLKPITKSRECMPTIQDLEIEGVQPDADGVELRGTFEAIISRVALRRLRHGLHLTERNRNVLISECQIYHNRGAGVFLDKVNLHQINIVGSHISYNRIGGIRIEASEIRNLQITGNDIEYNTDRTHGIRIEPTAEIYIDTTAPGSSVDEIAITSNTIQARPSADGANVRIIGSAEEGQRPPGLWVITGNVVGSQTNNIHLTRCYGVTITGNSIYSAARHNVLLEHCRQIVVGSNHLRRHTPKAHAGVRLEDSRDCIVSGCQILDESEQGQASGLSLLEIARCQRINVNGCQLLDGVPYGVLVESSSDCNFSGCTVLETRRPPRMRAAIAFRGEGTGNVVTGCRIGHGTEGALQVDETSDVLSVGNSIQRDAGS